MASRASQWERCTWCGDAVEPDDGFRLADAMAERGAVFCRLEHVVPWAIQGAHWKPAAPREPPSAETPSTCAQCGAGLAGGRLLLVRHRGGHRIPDSFCSIDHLLAWAKAGGRWGPARA